MNGVIEYKFEASPGFLNNSEKAFCRVCYESDESTLISPCNCSGSLKHIHEDCLKIWITVKYKDPKEAKCEVCGYRYNMNIKLKKKFNPKRGSVENFGYCCIIPILIFILLVLATVVVILSVYKRNVTNSLTNTIVILCLFSFPIISGLVMLCFAIYKILYVIEIEKWRIFEHKIDNGFVKVIPSLVVKINK